MPFLFNDKPGPGIEKTAPPAKGIRLFIQILFREFFSLIKVNCLFLLFSIPVVTIPAAYCAMNRISANMVQDQPYFLWNDFWGAFSSGFCKATAAGLILSGGIAVAVFSTFYYGRQASSCLYCLPLGISCIGFFWLLFMGFSVFPMIVLVNLPLKKILKNALLLVAPSIGCHILSFVACAALLLMALCFFPVSIIPAILLYPALFNLIVTFGAYGNIKRYVISEQQPEES